MNNYRNAAKNEYMERSEIKKVFAERLDRLINEKIKVKKGERREELASKLFHTEPTTSGKEKIVCYSKSEIDKWCSIRSTEFPTPEALIQLSEFLGCSIDYLYGKEDCPTHENTDIHNLTGLSDNAINALIKYKSDFEKPLPDRINKSYIENRLRLERMNIDCINMILEHEEGIEESFYNDSILVMIYQYVKSIDPEFCYHDHEFKYDDKGEPVSANARVTKIEDSIAVSSQSMPLGYKIRLKEMYPTVFKDMLLRKIEEYRD